MIELLWVGLGGFLGAVLRYGISIRMASSPFPAGILAVNVLGCLLIGVLMAFTEADRISPQLQRFLGVGLLGALTTFSTFSWDTLDLVRSGAPAFALLNVLANVVLGLGAVILGLFLGRILL